MSQLVKMGATAAGTAIGGPVGGAIGAGLGGFAGSAAEGGNFWDSLGSGVTGGATQGIMQGMNPQIPGHARAGDSFGGAMPKMNESSMGLMDILSRARKPRKYMFAGQEQLGMPPEYLQEMMGASVTDRERQLYGI